MSKKEKQAVESEKQIKEKAREIALSTIEKQFGKGAIMNMGTDYLIDVPAYGTGVLSLDLALGRAIPKGRIIEIFGPESSGKTTLTLHIAANAQKAGHRVGFIDAEYALDIGYAANLGVKVDELDISQPDSGEQALNILQLLVESGAYGVLIVDSVAALTPQNEINGEVGDSHMGLQARMMSQALRKLTGAISRSNTTVIFINQLRMKIGVMFGNPETTTGGRALPFYASQRIDIRRIGAIKDGEDVVGNRTKIKIIKNKVAPPFKEVELDIMYGLGIERSRNLLTEAAKAGIVQKAGSWYSIGEEKIGQGAKNAADYIKERPELMDKMEEQIITFYKTGELPC